jgi:3-hydroxybutyryl-CoA dehydratase
VTLPEITHTIGSEQIDRYAELSGDRNPIHMDPEYVATTPFKTVIAHGPIALQTIFEAVTSWLGGVPPGVRIDVLFRGPVHIGDSVTCRAQDVRDHGGDLVISTQCTNQAGAEVMQAIVVVPRHLAPRE